MKKGNIKQKIEQARLTLCKMKGSLTSPEIVRVSQELDKYIVAYYKSKDWYNPALLLADSTAGDRGAQEPGDREAERGWPAEEGCKKECLNGYYPD